MKTPDANRQTTKKSALSEIADGLRYIMGHSEIRILIVLLAITNVFAVGYSSLLPAFARDVLHSGEFGLGWLSTAVGVGALIGALTLAALGHYNRKGLLLTVGNLLFPASVIGFAFSTSMPLSLALIAVSGFGFMVQNATVNTLIQSRVEDRLRGRVMSVYTVVFQGFFPIGALFAGTVAQHSSIALGAALGAGIALAFGLLLLWKIPEIRRMC